MSMSKQQGMALWLLIILFGILVAASAIGGWLFIAHLESQAIQELEQRPASAAQAPANRPPQPRPLLPSPLMPLPGPEIAPEDAAPIAMADLTLKGVITRSNPSRSRALIAKGLAAEQAYSEGEEIQDNVTLEAIDSHHVVLRVDSRRETLYLNRTLQGTAAAEQTAQQLEEPEPAPDSAAAGLLGNFLRNRNPVLSRNQGLAERVEGESEYLPTGQATDGVVSYDEAELETELEESGDAEDENRVDEVWEDDGSDEAEGMDQTGEGEDG